MTKCKNCGHNEDEHRQPDYDFCRETNKCMCEKFEGEDLKYCVNCLPDGNPSDECKIEGHKYEKYYEKKQGCGKRVREGINNYDCGFQFPMFLCPSCDHSLSNDRPDKEPWDPDVGSGSFNLSDKIQFAGEEDADSKVIEEKDVKEFIRRLKEELIIWNKLKLGNHGGKRLLRKEDFLFMNERIDKLAGEKLI